MNLDYLFIYYCWCLFLGGLSLKYIQNIPQVLIQIVFIIFILEGNDIIVYIAMSFSLLSIIISTLSMVSTRKILRNTDYVSIQFDVTGLLDVRNYRNRVKKSNQDFQQHLV